MRYLLNAPLLTAYGDFRFTGPLGLQKARALAREGLASAVGHAGTARFLEGLLQTPVAAQRRAISMQPGDQALVFRLLGRLPEGTVLDADQLQGLPFEFGLLERVA